MEIVKIIGSGIIQIQTILWNMILDIWTIIKNFVIFLFVGIIVPIGFVYLSAKCIIWLGPEEPGMPVDMSIPYGLSIIAILYIYIVTKNYIELIKSKNA